MKKSVNFLRSEGTKLVESIKETEMHRQVLLSTTDELGEKIHHSTSVVRWKKLEGRSRTQSLPDARDVRSDKRLTALVIAASRKIPPNTTTIEEPAGKSK